MIPQELKNSILQLAIQGKLVEQRPEEDPAISTPRGLPPPQHKTEKIWYNVRLDEQI